MRDPLAWVTRWVVIGLAVVLLAVLVLEVAP